MLTLWCITVLVDRKKSVAIWALVRPLAIAASTSSSRAVRLYGLALVAGVAAAASTAATRRSTVPAFTGWGRRGGTAPSSGGSSAATCDATPIAHPRSQPPAGVSPPFPAPTPLGRQPATASW